MIYAIIIVLFVEVFGFWYIKYEANIGEVEIEHVYFVLHMSVIGLFFSIISVPYRGFIIAKEDMKSYAYIDLLSVFLNFLDMQFSIKLIIAIKKKDVNWILPVTLLSATTIFIFI